MSTLRKYLTQYLLLCNKQQLVSQRIRQTLSLNPYFQLSSIFQRFDKYKKGYLQPADFSQFMLENQLYPNKPQLYIIFKDFDQNQNGIITLQNFQHQLLPRQHPKLKKSVLLRPPYPVNFQLQIQIEFLLTKYFKHKIHSIQQSTLITNKIKALKPNALYQAFKQIDTTNQQSISTPQQLDTFLRKNGTQLSLPQLSRIYRSLNFNTTQNISLQTFKQHLDPTSSTIYSIYQQRQYQKQLKYQNFIKKKQEVELLKKQNIIQENQLIFQINSLRDSNRRLIDIIDQQTLSNRENIQKYERRRQYF